MKTKVLALLKPKAKPLGFTEEELDGVAANLAGNLTDQSTDEQINTAIDSVIPFLKVSQTAVNRIVNAQKPKPDPSKPTDPPTDPIKPAGGNDDEPSWFKAYREAQEKRIEQLESKNIGEQRRSIFEAKLEGLLPKQKEDMLDDFNLISPSFKTDEEFNAYLLRKEGRISEIKQELADEGLAKMAPPKGGGQTKSEEDEFAELMTDINKKPE
ncbi:MAG: hypothetical protein ACK5M3_05580 [Dysgonomonas sp.]